MSSALTDRKKGNSASDRVAVFGGGPGGLSAALELAERGFSVDLFEREALGGKARSYRIENTGTEGRGDLPAEIGPHMVVGFYGTLPDQLRRIPGRKGGSIFDELSPLTGAKIAWKGDTIAFPEGKPPTAASVFSAIINRRRPRDPGKSSMRRLMGQLSVKDKTLLATKVLTMLSSGELRQYGQMEHQSVADFMATDKMSPTARQLLKMIDGAGLGVLNRMNARTCARVMAGFMRVSFGEANFRQWFLGATGPFSEVIWEPWGDHLRSLGVNIHLKHELISLEYADGQITSAIIRDDSGEESSVDADYYVLAMPAERVASIVDGKLAEVDPALGRIKNIEPTLLCGLTVYLTEEVPELYELHYSASEPWGAAVINYAKLWDQQIDELYGDGTVKGYLSIDIPDWETPGIIYGKSAKDLDPEHIFHETIAQLRRDVPDGERLLPDSLIHSWYLSRTTQAHGTDPVTHLEHLFVNTPSCMDNQPEATTAVKNLFLASSYVRTDNGLGVDSMDSATEAGCRATNGILTAAGSAATPAEVARFVDVWFLKPLLALDNRLYRRGRRNIFDLIHPTTRKRDGMRSEQSLVSVSA
ncbi:NAD(P)-binding protein [Nocardia uniformis]|uniref:NAD(P)-binding protein n=1 Tax=Nocardia uniformis TaxID=53432 RepID=A0A849C0A4_9NOCA|nr:FAD-dependent oxidoreductase [Nocardia uniformis]NNH70876.1 NAD(P)-binding protein [Nocardia uniformis]